MAATGGMMYLVGAVAFPVPGAKYLRDAGSSLVEQGIDKLSSNPSDELDQHSRSLARRSSAAVRLHMGVSK